MRRAGAVADSDQVIQSEVAILSSNSIKEKTIQDIGLARIEPKLGAAYATADLSKQRAIMGAAIKQMGAKLKIATAPDTSVVRVTYSNQNPLIAALVLNTLIDEYLKYRTTVLTAQDAGCSAPSGRISRSVWTPPTRLTRRFYPITGSATSKPKRPRSANSTLSS